MKRWLLPLLLLAPWAAHADDLLLSNDTVFSSTTRTNAPNQTANSTSGTGDLGWYDTNGGVWSIQGGSLLTIPVTAGGSGYTLTPSVVISTTVGSGKNKVNALATATVVSNAVSSVTLTNAGRDYQTVANPTFSGGGGGVGATMGSPTLTGNELVCVTTNTQATSQGSQNYLVRNSSITSLNQGVKAYFANTATTDNVIPILRMQSATKELYACSCGQTRCSVFYFNNYNGTTGTATNLKNINYSTSLVVGKQYSAYCAAIGANPTNISVVFTNETDGVIIASDSVNNSNANVQSAGQLGLGSSGVLSAVTRLQQYSSPGITPSPSSVGLNISSTPITLSGLGTSWLTATPTFTLLGGNAFIWSQSVTSDIQATIWINTGNQVATAIITDTVSLKTGNLSLVPIQSPNASIPYLSITSVGCDIVPLAAPTLGNPPYTWQLYRSSFSNLVAGDGFSSVIYTSPTVADGVNIGTYTDTTAGSAVQFYRWYVTDSSGQFVGGNQAGARIPSRYGLNVGMIGDSITAGHAASSLVSRICSIDISSGGVGYTSSDASMTFSGGGGVGATGFCPISGSSVAYCYLTNQGYGYNSETVLPTITITGGGGTGATASVHSVGASPAIQLEKILQIQYGFKDLKVLDAGVGGSPYFNWTPHGTSNIPHSTTNAQWYLEAAEAMFGGPSKTPVIIMRSGANDANALQSSTTYKTYLQIIVSTLTAQGYKVIVDEPFYWGNQTEARNLLLQQYGPACAEVVAATPNSYLSGVENFGQFLNSPELLADFLHPNDAGYGVLAGQLAKTTASVLGFITNTANTGTQNLCLFGCSTYP